MRFLLKDYGDTNFITGLRGLAASLVVIAHTSAFDAFGEWGREISNSGQLGVQAFFVIAGFTIAQTRFSAIGLREYIIRRFVRLAPLYYTVLLLCVILNISGFKWNTYYGDLVGYVSTPIDILVHFSFLSWLDIRTGNSLIGVEWTLPVEIFWYICLLPFLRYLTGSFWQLLLSFLTLVFIEIIFDAIYTYYELHPWQWSWSPWQYGWYFALGSISWKLRKSDIKHQPYLQMFGIFCFFAALCGAKQDEILMSLGVSMIIVSTAKTQRDLVNQLLTSRLLIFVGSLSYGLYLVHLPVTFALRLFIGPSWLLFICTFLISIILSMALSVFVEKTMRVYFLKKLL